MNDANRRPVAIVSGSSSGIGRACAIRLAAAGLDLVVNYAKRERGAEETAERCRAHGVEAIVVEGDVARDEGCRRLVTAAVSRWARLDVVVNNAGVTRFADIGDLDALSKEDFEAIFSVNVSGAYQLTRAARPYLRESPIASVVNMSSHSGISGFGSSLAYAASKGALNTLTLGLARALAPEIRVNAVCPGFVDTQWMAGKLSEAEMGPFKERMASTSALKRLVSPEDVAEAVSWFALGGRSITGQLLVIDSGTHLVVGDPIGKP